MRAGGVRDRPGLGARVVEGDPAGDHLGRHEVVEVAAVLVHPERLRARRLPDHVVLEDADAVPAHELRGEAAGPLGQDLHCEAAVGLPAVADLPRAVVGVAARDPVHVVRPDAGLVAAGEQCLEALAQAGDGVRVDEAFLHDEEAVALERLELLGAPAVEAHARGRRLSVS
jgi:hypothetical protein